MAECIGVAVGDVLSSFGLPFADVLDFGMDLFANISMTDDPDEEVVYVGKLGLRCLALSCVVNAGMVLYHTRVQQSQLYDELRGKDWKTSAAFYLWSLIAVKMCPDRDFGYSD